MNGDFWSGVYSAIGVSAYGVCGWMMAATMRKRFIREGRGESWNVTDFFSIMAVWPALVIIYGIAVGMFDWKNNGDSTGEPQP